MAYEIDFIGVGDEVKKMQTQLQFVGRMIMEIIKLLFMMVDFRLMVIK